jgi:hypothetical protein
LLKFLQECSAVFGGDDPVNLQGHDINWVSFVIRVRFVLFKYVSVKNVVHIQSWRAGNSDNGVIQRFVYSKNIFVKHLLSGQRKQSQILREGLDINEICEDTLVVFRIVLFDVSHICKDDVNSSIVTNFVSVMKGRVFLDKVFFV